ncbi:MAG: twin-arginine translocase TatA/TatE family subunit [Omnitrophica WOR_2 bacterium]
MPFGIQPIHLLVIAVVALLIFGPSRLPEIGRGMGKAFNEFRHGFRDMSEGIMDEANRPEKGSMNSDLPEADRIASVPPVVHTCPECGANNSIQARFCNSCGTKLAEE